METFRVATLNVWNRFGPWEERLPVLRRALAALAPDVLGMQEVLVLPDGSFDQLALIGEGLGYHAVWGRSPEPDGWPVGNAFLSRWPIARSETLALPDNGTGERRCVLFAELDAPFAKVPCFVTHLNWKLDDGAARALQVKRLVEIVRDLAPAHGFPPLVMGDFNAEPDADEVRYLRGLTGLGGECVYFCDCWAAAGDGSAGATFVRRNPYAGTGQEPDRRIDYVFVRGPNERLEGVARACRLAFDAPVGDVWASDHLGVLATITV